MKRLALALILLLLCISSAWACLIVSGYPASIDGEDVLIVWDETHKVEHLVRRVSFQTQGPDLGFLVPTPTRPELSEAPDGLFSALAGQIRPPVRSVMVESVFMTFIRTRSLSLGAVHVLEERRVAGYEAAVLQSTDSKALEAWLKEHNYPASAALEQWLRPYSERGWIVTAFKVSRSEPKALPTSAIHMTFRSERPFFPYREPPSDGRGRMRMFFVGPWRAQGHLEDGSPWHSELLYANSLPKQTLAGLVHFESGLTTEGWLTAFFDVSHVRSAGGDLIFEPSSAGPFLPNPVITGETHRIYIEPSLLVLAVLVGAWRRRRGR